MKNSKIIIIVLGIIVFLILSYFYFQEEGLNVSSSYPKNNQQYVLDSQKLIIQFSKSLDSNQAKQISYISNPEIVLQPSWLDKQTLELKPEKPLEKNTLYSIEVLFKKRKIYNFSFTTNAYSSIDLEEQAQIQIEDDLEYAAARQKISKDFPWYDSLPLRKQDYIVVFSFENNHFRIHPNSAINDSQKAELIKTVTEELKSINAPTDKYDIIVINPNN